MLTKSVKRRVQTDWHQHVMVTTELCFWMFQGKSYVDNLMEEDLIKTKECRLSTAKEEFYKTSISFILNKNSPLTNVFSQK